MSGVAAAACGLLALAPRHTLAHGFGQRYDLPVPLWLWVTGGAAAVVLSFVVVGVFVRGTPGLRILIATWDFGTFTSLLFVLVVKAWEEEKRLAREREGYHPGETGGRG